MQTSYIDTRKLCMSCAELASIDGAFIVGSFINTLAYKLNWIGAVDPTSFLIGGGSLAMYAVIDVDVRVLTGKGLTERIIDTSYSLYKKLSETIKI